MVNSLRNQIFYLWKTPLERKGLNQNFKTEFIRYIGIDKMSEYDSIIKTLITKAEEDKEHSVYFDREVPFQLNPDFVRFIKNELQTMNISQLSKEDIKMFEDEETNNVFLKALEYVVNKAIIQENFQSSSIRDNFIVKTLLNVYTYIKDLKIEKEITNKCIYYGDIHRHDVYFLLLLHKMNFDVLYINPTRDSNEIISIDTDKISVLVKSKGIDGVKTLKDRMNNGSILSENKSTILDFENQIEREMFTDSGFFRPWQFKENGTTQAVFFNSSIIDLEQNWLLDARLRDGFKVVDRTVHVPNFFFEIEGVYDNSDKQNELIQRLKQDSLIFVVKDKESILTENIFSKNIPDALKNPDNRYALVNCLKNDRTFNIEKVKELNIYPFEKYKDSTEDFILNKINETILDTGLYKKELDTRENLVSFCFAIFLLKVELIRAIDNFDFPNKVPKIFIFIEDENSLDKIDSYILGFLTKVGFDIVILTPAGTSSISSHINNHRFNSIRLDKLMYDEKWDLINKIKTKTFWSSLFN